MKIVIISPGKAHDATVADGIAEFEKRLTARYKPEWVFPKPGSIEDEAGAIFKNIKEGDFVVLLDERGKTVSSADFAKLIEREEQNSKRLVFIIGGAFGVSGAVKKRASLTLKLSDLVFPHMLVRFIVIEQLYRASSILSGGKYHHA